MLHVGLTGGIGAGKSSVSAAMRDLGAHILDADQLARELLVPGSEALEAVAEAFGPGLLTASGELDRQELARRVFADEAARARLDAILHPRINALEARRAAALAERFPSAVVVYDAALLLESGAEAGMDRVVVVDVAPAVQWQRTLARGERSAEQIQAIMDAQWPRARRLQKADDIIDNNGPWSATGAQVAQLMERYRALARTGPAQP
ncbi:MAG TPA: dephospho-CoA kinase [Gammaproteobacteria bacterium]|nr:dephospho-CoA kinase [Gammaproteobacteria bacterium]